VSPAPFEAHDRLVVPQYKSLTCNGFTCGEKRLTKWWTEIKSQSL
jgi:hypothetical protein